MEWKKKRLHTLFSIVHTFMQCFPKMGNRMSMVSVLFHTKWYSQFAIKHCNSQNTCMVTCNTNMQASIKHSTNSIRKTKKQFFGKLYIWWKWQFHTEPTMAILHECIFPVVFWKSLWMTFPFLDSNCISEISQYQYFIDSNAYQFGLVYVNGYVFIIIFVR